MIVKGITPRCVLLDANVIIEAYKLEAWQLLIERAGVIVPSIVAFDETLFFSKRIGGVPEAILLSKLIDLGKIKLVSATVPQMHSLRMIFDRVFVEGLHDGEVEALALLLSNSVDNAFFCTGDALAIQALAMIGHSESGISMELLLKSNGLKKPLPVQFTEQFLKTNLGIGRQNFITGTGLRR